MALTKLSSKAQIVLPAQIRRQLGIHPGDQLEITADADVITIRKSPASATEALATCGGDIWKDFETKLQEARDQWQE